MSAPVKAPANTPVSTLRSKLYQFCQPVHAVKTPGLQQYFIQATALLPLIFVLCTPLTILVSRTHVHSMELAQGWWFDLIFITLNLGGSWTARKIESIDRREILLVCLFFLHTCHLCFAHLAYDAPLTSLSSTFFLFPPLAFSILPLRPFKAGALALLFGCLLSLGVSLSKPGLITSWEVYLSPVLLFGSMCMFATQIVRKLWARKHEERKHALARTRLVEMGRRTAAMAHALKSPIAASTHTMVLFDELLTEWIQSVDHPDVNDQDLVEIYNELRQTHQQNQLALARTQSFLLGLHQQTQQNPGLCIPFSPMEQMSRHLRAQDQSLSDIVNLRNQAPDAMLLGSPEQFLLIISNLLQNAAHACASHQNPRIILTQRMSEDTLEIEVRDNGPGIPDAMKERIFEPMVTTRVDGTGLGLLVSRDTARGFFDGELVLQPSTQGACFVFSAPTHQQGGVKLTPMNPIHNEYISGR